MFGRGREGESVSGLAGAQGGISATGKKNVSIMEKWEIEELIAKCNEGLTDPSETKRLEQLIEEGLVELTQLHTLSKLEAQLLNDDEAVPSLKMDDAFYGMLAEEKRKERKGA